MSAGLTWEDDTTQEVLSSEMSKLRRIPFRPKQSGAVYTTDSRLEPSSAVRSSVLGIRVLLSVDTPVSFLSLVSADF